MNLTIKAIDHHRNGVCGAPFNVVLFRDEAEQANMVGIIFYAPDHVAVLDVDKAAAGDVAFGSNSWRGDHYEDDLRQACETWTHLNWTPDMSRLNDTLTRAKDDKINEETA